MRKLIRKSAFADLRINLMLEELPLKICNAFWHPKEKRVTSYEKLKLLSVMGVVPFYLEQIRRKTTHKKIVTCLANGPKELVQICAKLGKMQGGLYSKNLDDLVKAGFVKRDFVWDFKSGKEGKLSRYRLSDNYLRFYLKYIAPNCAKIEKGNFSTSISLHLPGWESILGLQFENLVVHNSKTLWQMLEITPEKIVAEGPFFQSATTRQEGCQIDYMIQTRFHNLYICEIKFSKSPIGHKIIKEMEYKRKRLKVPRYCSIRPVLIHVNGV